MVKISRTDKRFSRLATPTLSAASILERSDLQEYIFNSPDAFCDELGRKMMIIAKEVPTGTVVADRIDLLAVDSCGDTIVIELKRGNDKLQLLQAVAYAGMVANWSSDQIVQFAGDRADSIAEFVEVESEQINGNQRILLIAEAFDYEVLVAAEWLYQKYEVEIACVRVVLARDEASGAEYLTFAQVFPTPELAEVATRRGKGFRPPPPGDWETVLSAVNNRAEADFFKQQLSKSQSQVENKLQHRRLVFRVGDRLRFDMWLRKDHASTHQRERFPGDVAFWQKNLKSPDNVHEVFHGECVRFRLYTAEDFAAFEKAVTGELRTVDWGNVDLAQKAVV